MVDAQRIRDKEVHKVIDQFRKDRTIVTLKLLNRNYERLTMVTDVSIEKETSFFLIDYPYGFKEAVTGTSNWRLYFECTGKDKILYRFRTSGDKIDGQEIRVKFPSFIEKVQRRRHFRVPAPSGTCLRAIIDSTPYELKTVNISQGGVLAGFVLAAPEVPPIKIGSKLERLELIFRDKEENIKVLIDQAKVVRTDSHPKTDETVYGLKFTALSRKAEKLLVDLIYKYQREFIRRASKLYE